jgi:hypothetical protein
MRWLTEQWQRETQAPGDTPVPMSLCPPYIPHTDFSVTEPAVRRDILQKLYIECTRNYERLRNSYVTRNTVTFKPPKTECHWCGVPYKMPLRSTWLLKSSSANSRNSVFQSHITWEWLWKNFWKPCFLFRSIKWKVVLQDWKLRGISVWFTSGFWKRTQTGYVINNTLWAQPI